MTIRQKVAKIPFPNHEGPWCTALSMFSCLFLYSSIDFRPYPDGREPGLPRQPSRAAKEFTGCAVNVNEKIDTASPVRLR